jgi:phosphoglycerate dehydrogenase-like enzyme
VAREGERLAVAVNASAREWESVFPPRIERELEFRAELVRRPLELLDEWDGPPIRAVISTWGARPLTEDLLHRMPDLEVVFHAAGSVKSFVTDALISRRVAVISAAGVNARPVAEFVLGVILVSLKNLVPHHHSFLDRGPRGWDVDRVKYPGGCYHTRVGLLGFGHVARLIVGMLGQFDIDVWISDPHVDVEQLSDLGVQVADDDWIIENCDVISLHHADVPRNHNLLDRGRLSRLKPNARLINTARGRLVDHDALADVLSVRPDITAYLDVTWPEPLPESSPLYGMPNCIMTPHIAGSTGREVERMSRFVLAQLDRWISGFPAASLDGIVDYTSLGERA